ncbi:MAG: hypothetical protein ACE5H5_01975 [Nitrospinota bacterium]
MAGALPGTEFLALLERTGFAEAEQVAVTGYQTSDDTLGATFRAVKPA